MYITECTKAVLQSSTETEEVMSPSSVPHSAHFSTHPWHSTNVVLVAVGDDQGLDLVTPLVQKGGVWKDLGHAQVRVAAGQWTTAAFVQRHVCVCVCVCKHSFPAPLALKEQQPSQTAAISHPTQKHTPKHTPTALSPLTQGTAAPHRSGCSGRARPPACNSCRSRPGHQLAAHAREDHR